MKAKLEILLREGHLANLPEFEKLHKNYLSKAEKVKKSKAAAERAHKILDEKLSQGRMDGLFSLEPKTAFLVAKFRKKIAKAELELDKKRLEVWLEAFLKKTENVDLSKYLDKKQKENRDKSEKTASEKDEKAEKKAAKTTVKPAPKAKSGEK